MKIKQILLLALIGCSFFLPALQAGKSKATGAPSPKGVLSKGLNNPENMILAVQITLKDMMAENQTETIMFKRAVMLYMTNLAHLKETDDGRATVIFDYMVWAADNLLPYCKEEYVDQLLSYFTNQINQTILPDMFVQLYRLRAKIYLKKAQFEEARHDLDNGIEHYSVPYLSNLLEAYADLYKQIPPQHCKEYSTLLIGVLSGLANRWQDMETYLDLFFRAGKGAVLESHAILLIHAFKHVLLKQETIEMPLRLDLLAGYLHLHEVGGGEWDAQHRALAQKLIDGKEHVTRNDTLGSIYGFMAIDQMLKGNFEAALELFEKHTNAFKAHLKKMNVQDRSPYEYLHLYCKARVMLERNSGTISPTHRGILERPYDHSPEMRNQVNGKAFLKTCRRIIREVEEQDAHMRQQATPDVPNFKEMTPEQALAWLEEVD